MKMCKEHYLTCLWIPQRRQVTKTTRHYLTELRGLHSYGNMLCGLIVVTDHGREVSHGVWGFLFPGLLGNFSQLGRGEINGEGSDFDLQERRSLNGRSPTTPSWCALVQRGLTFTSMALS